MLIMALAHARYSGDGTLINQHVGFYMLSIFLRLILVSVWPFEKLDGLPCQLQHHAAGCVSHPVSFFLEARLNQIKFIDKPLTRRVRAIRPILLSKASSRSRPCLKLARLSSRTVILSITLYVYLFSQFSVALTHNNRTWLPPSSIHGILLL